MLREQKTSTGINLTASEGPSAEKKPKQEEIQTVMVEKVMETILASSLLMSFLLILFNFPLQSL